MSAAATLLLGAVLCAPGATAATDSAGDGVRARLVLEPERVEVGEPQVWTLSVDHPAGVTPRLAHEGLELDESWVVLDRAPQVTLQDPQRAGRAITLASWTVASLEPGSRALPALMVQHDAQGAPRTIQIEGRRVEVAGLLEEGEDAPRPLRGFRDVEELPEPASPWPGVLLVGGLLALVVLVLVVRGRRRRTTAPVAPRPLERLAELERGEHATPEAVRDAHYHLTRLVREEADRTSGEDRAGLTDEEWLRRALAQFEPSRREPLEELFARSAEVKYGGAQRTRWSLEETFTQGRSVLESLAGSEAGR